MEAIPATCGPRAALFGPKARFEGEGSPHAAARRPGWRSFGHEGRTPGHRSEPRKKNGRFGVSCGCPAFDARRSGPLGPEASGDGPSSSFLGGVSAFVRLGEERLSAVPKRCSEPFLVRGPCSAANRGSLARIDPAAVLPRRSFSWASGPRIRSPPPVVLSDTFERFRKSPSITLLRNRWRRARATNRRSRERTDSAAVLPRHSFSWASGPRIRSPPPLVLSDTFERFRKSPSITLLRNRWRRGRATNRRSQASPRDEAETDSLLVTFCRSAGDVSRPLRQTRIRRRRIATCGGAFSPSLSHPKPRSAHHLADLGDLLRGQPMRRRRGTRCLLWKLAGSERRPPRVQARGREADDPQNPAESEDAAGPVDRANEPVLVQFEGLTRDERNERP